MKNYFSDNKNTTKTIQLYDTCAILENMRSIIQVPISPQLRLEATQVAHSQGFSSLQEVIRVLLHQLAAGKLEIQAKPVLEISKERQQRYAAMVAEMQRAPNSPAAASVDELMEQLRADA